MSENDSNSKRLFLHTTFWQQLGQPLPVGSGMMPNSIQNDIQVSLGDGAASNFYLCMVERCFVNDLVLSPSVDSLSNSLCKYYVSLV